ncbi:MAG TPA: hypothetical protein VIX37_10765 [Candidatus Sulfotelmatobacter sp.]
MALSLVAWFLAPFDLYRRKQKEIEGLGKELEEQKQRRPHLVVYPEAGSKYYTEIDRSSKKVRGIYIDLRLTLENRGGANSIIRRFELYVQETRRRYDELQPSGRDSILTPYTQYTGLKTDWIGVNGTVVVKAENVLAGSLPLYLNETEPPKTRELHCTLTLTDSVGTQARCQFVITDANANLP